MSRIVVGVGGWTFEPWRGEFYPAGLPHKQELSYAAERLTSIEINGTYYGTQKPESFARWRDETPDDFVFSLKGPRYTTNRRELAAAAASIERFLASGLLELREKLGPINWQFMPTKAFDAEDFAAFLALLPAEIDGRALRHAVEVRHDSFRNDAFIALARAHRVAIVLAGDSEYPLIDAPTAGFVYARLMGTQEDRPEGYTRPAIDRWAQRLLEWQASGLDVFCYIISGAKLRNPAAAMALLRRLAKPAARKT
jgi:uncharacterized protein YecE (DUF72 family)